MMGVEIGDFMEYKVIVCSSFWKLEEAVNKFLKEGWELQGGASCTFVPTDSERHEFRYCQAIIKK